MEPPLQSKPWKRVIESQQEQDEEEQLVAVPDTGDSHQSGGSKSKRLRSNLVESAPSSGPPGHPSDLSSPLLQSSVAGNSYGPSTVSDHGQLHNGNAYYNTGPASQIWGPSVLNGEMRVHLSNVYHTYNNGSPQTNDKDAQEQALKSLLYYSSMDDRKAQLKMVEPASFDWIWTHTAFPNWLAGNDGLFWISGKPASGKSTLTHHLSSDRVSSHKVLRHLESSGRKWLLVRFYFDFRAGSSMANTMLGMLRSMLLQLVKDSTDIEDYVLKQCQHRLNGNWPVLEAELLELLCQAFQTTNTSICGFVDGLDEYAGSVFKLIDFLLMIQKRSNMKLCLASRPETELLHRLRGIPTFTMQHHNHMTIGAYVDTAIADIAHFVPIDQLRDILRTEIVAHADGVILWAVFATDEAVKAALRGCTSNEIRQHIESFPQELFSVYRRIWEKLSLPDQRLAAAILFVIRYWNSSFDEGYWVIPPTLLKSTFLTCCCRDIVRKIDHSLAVDVDFTELHFRLKTYAMLGGLVEFVDSREGIADTGKEPRLSHKTVETFLQQLPEYLHHTEEIHKVVEARMLGPVYLAHAIIKVCDAFIPNSGLLIRFDESLADLWTGKTDYHKSGALNSITECMQLLGRRTSLDCAREISKTALIGVPRLLRDSRLNRSYHADLVVSVSQTWLMRHFGIPTELLLWHSRRNHCGCQPHRLGIRLPVPFSHGYEDLTNFVHEHPEALCLELFFFHDAMELLMKQAGLSGSTCGELIRSAARTFELASSCQSQHSQLEAKECLASPWSWCIPFRSMDRIGADGKRLCCSLPQLDDVEFQDREKDMCVSSADISSSGSTGISTSDSVSIMNGLSEESAGSS